MTILLPVIIRSAAGARCTARRRPLRLSRNLLELRRRRASGAARKRPRSQRRHSSRPTRPLRRRLRSEDALPARALLARRPVLRERTPAPRPLQRQNPAAARHPPRRPTARHRPGSRSARHRLTSLGGQQTWPNCRCKRRLMNEQLIAEQQARRPTAQNIPHTQTHGGHFDLIFSFTLV